MSDKHEAEHDLTDIAQAMEAVVDAKLDQQKAHDKYPDSTLSSYDDRIRVTLSEFGYSLARVIDGRVKHILSNIGKPPEDEEKL
jgi:hypothetical protein